MQASPAKGSPPDKVGIDGFTAGAVPQVIVNVPNAGPKEGAADILNGVAAVLWPLVIALIFIISREQIISLSRRVRNAKAFGAEAEFEKELVALNREANRAKEETGAGLELQQLGATPEVSNIPNDSVKSAVLSETARAPRLGLMLLSAEIDKLARRNAASTGHPERRTLREQLEIWNSQLPPHTSAAYRLFSHVRNRIVHGAEASEQEILSAIDSGLGLYDALLSIPIEANVVAHPGVDIFSDQAATQLAGGKGIIIETTHAGAKSFRIFPVTQSHFVPGMRLT